MAVLFTTQLRGWNRISVVLAFLGLLAVAVAIDRLRERVRGPVLAGALAVLLVVGALDQTSPEFRPPYERTQAKWAARRQIRAGGRGAPRRQGRRGPAPLPAVPGEPAPAADARLRPTGRLPARGLRAPLVLRRDEEPPDGLAGRARREAARGAGPRGGGGRLRGPVGRRLRVPRHAREAGCAHEAHRLAADHLRGGRFSFFDLRPYCDGAPTRARGRAVPRAREARRCTRPGRGDQRFSAMRGASRWKTHSRARTPRRRSHPGSASRSAPPTASQTGGAVGSIIAWRICVKIAASGLAA